MNQLPKEVIQSHVLPFIAFTDNNLHSINKLFSILNYEKYCYHYTQPHGKLIYYSPETKEIAAIIEYKEGIKHGLQKVYNHKINLSVSCLWFENKNLYAEAEYKNGIENGYNRIYNKDKKLLIDGNCLNGKIDGIYTIYEENGIIRDKIMFKEGSIC